MRLTIETESNSSQLYSLIFTLLNPILVILKCLYNPTLTRCLLALLKKKDVTEMRGMYTLEQVEKESCVQSYYLSL